MNFLTTHNVKGSEDKERIDFYREVIQSYRSHLAS